LPVKAVRYTTLSRIMRGQPAHPREMRDERNSTICCFAESGVDCRVWAFRALPGNDDG
jgi:hypothetical protein